MNTSWFKQWLAVRKQVTFLIPILLLALAFAVVVIVGKQSDANQSTSSIDAILLVQSGKQVHSFEVDSKTGKIVKSDVWELVDGESIATNKSTDDISEKNAHVWIDGDALLTGTEKPKEHRVIFRDQALKELGPKATILLWGRKPDGKASN